MWEKQWVAFAQTEEGGKLTEDQAIGKWAEWRRQKEIDPESIIWDLEGPNQEKPLQFRVKLSKAVDFINEYAHGRDVESKTKAVKNASADDVLKMRERALANAEGITSANMEVNFGSLAQKMVSAGGDTGRAFQADTMKLGGMRNLLDSMPSTRGAQAQLEDEAADETAPQ